LHAIPTTVNENFGIFCETPCKDKTRPLTRAV
jgi:hypothetical protein